MKLDIPLTVECDYGKTWLEAHWWTDQARDDRNDSNEESPDNTNDVGTPKISKTKARTITLTAKKVKGTKNDNMV